MIPRIIHQIWIGNLPRPTKMMETWRNKHPEFEYQLWTDEHMNPENQDSWVCKNQMEICPELCGIADIMRLEILWKYGGIFIDADSECIESLNDFIMNRSGFAVFENETARPGLIANGAIGFCKEHPLVGDMIEEIRSGKLDSQIPHTQCWKVLGPVLITRFLNTGKYPDVSVFPSYYFFPEHHTKLPIYDGHKKVYAHQWWGTSNQSYNELQTYQLPSELLTCSEGGVSILVSSYNTPVAYIHECLESIRNQRGNFYMELVWINDGSSTSYTMELEAELNQFRETTRFCKVKYLRTDENRGVAHAVNDGLKLCTNEIIVKMDADDIMMPTRISKQLAYMKEHPECHICGTQIHLFRCENQSRLKKQICGQTAHPSRVSWNYLQENKGNRKSKWFANHPTICFRKSTLLDIGGYSTDKELRAIHDYELLIRWLRITGGEIHNLDEPLLLYRLHEHQLTYGLDTTEETEFVRQRILS